MQSQSYCFASLSAAAGQFVQIYFKRWQLACEPPEVNFAIWEVTFCSIFKNTFKTIKTNHKAKKEPLRAKILIIVHLSIRVQCIILGTNAASQEY